MQIKFSFFIKKFVLEFFKSLHDKYNKTKINKKITERGKIISTLLHLQKKTCITNLL